MARFTSGALVAGLTLAAITAVGVLAAQAAGSPVRPPGRAGAATEGPGAGGAAAGRAQGHVLPAGSGSGERVVFSLGDEWVWLVDADDRVRRTYGVVTGSVLPAVGSHTVFARRAGGVGGDGAPVEHVVLFASTDGTNVGFSAAADGSMTRPDPTRQNAAVRERRDDADALWKQATIGSRVEVVR